MSQMALKVRPLSQTSSPFSTPTPSRQFRGYATTLKDLLNSRTDLDDSFVRLALLLPQPTGESSTAPSALSGARPISPGG